jgi:hypothetical protein
MQESNPDLGCLIVEVSRSHSIKNTQPVELIWTGDQLVTETATYTTHNKHKRRYNHTLSVLRTRDPSNPYILVTGNVNIRAIFWTLNSINLECQHVCSPYVSKYVCKENQVSLVDILTGQRTGKQGICSIPGGWGKRTNFKTSPLVLLWPTWTRVRVRGILRGIVHAYLQHLESSMF